MRHARCVSAFVAALAMSISGVTLARQSETTTVAPGPAPAAQTPASSEAVSPEQRLVRVRRIYVESFGDDPISKQVQAMMVDSLMKTKRFVVTENKDRADAILKGSAVEKTSQELHAISESGSAMSATSGGSASVNGSGNGRFSGSARAASVARGASVEDSQVTTETIDDARVSVRLVDPNGDILWTSTQESQGAKYKGASADASDKIAKQLMREITRIEKSPTAP